MVSEVEHYPYPEFDKALADLMRVIRQLRTERGLLLSTVQMLTLCNSPEGEIARRALDRLDQLALQAPD